MAIRGEQGVLSAAESANRSPDHQVVQHRCIPLQLQGGLWTRHGGRAVSPETDRGAATARRRIPRQILVESLGDVDDVPATVLDAQRDGAVVRCSLEVARCLLQPEAIVDTDLHRGAYHARPLKGTEGDRAGTHAVDVSDRGRRTGQLPRHQGRRGAQRLPHIHRRAVSRVEARMREEDLVGAGNDDQADGQGHEDLDDREAIACAAPSRPLAPVHGVQSAR